MTDLTITTHDECLSSRVWSEILGKSERHIRRACKSAGLISRSALPADWREDLNTLMVQQSATSCRELHAFLTGRKSQWQPRKHLIEMREESQKRARIIRDVLIAHFELIATGTPLKDARKLTALSMGKALGETKPVSEKTIIRWEQRIDRAGGIEAAPEAAFADGRNGAAKKGKSFPPDFAKWFTAQFLDSKRGLPSLGNIYNQCETLWERREIIPGLGIREGREPFPYTKGQLNRLMPGRASRELAGRGKFQTKVSGYSAATPLNWDNVEPVRVVMFDDKLLDCHILTDDGRRSFRPQVYIAYCAGTRRVLAYIAREEGRMTQLDIEGLQAAVLRDHGLGGPEAGYITKWIKERGTVSISDARKDFLQRQFFGRLEICRTMMLGGKSAPGEYTQKGSGNFFGKGVLEAFMGSLDHMAKSIPGQSGNHYSRQPATLGDTTLTLEKIMNSVRAGHKPARSLIEEGILTAAMARLLDYLENGENVTAALAAQRSGIKPQMLFFSDFVAALGELFRAFNNRRGHRMQGFQTIRVPHPSMGGVMEVTESPNDKAERMLALMTMQGRHLVRPADADIAALLHKVKRVTVTANGCRTEDNHYWHPHSNAMSQAAAIQGGAKTYLALYNPVAPAALYLLANPPGNLPATATELPPGFMPQLCEILPLHEAASPVDKQAMLKRGEGIAAFNARASRELVLGSESILLARAEDRLELKDRLEPLRATIRSAQSPVAPVELPASGIATSIAEAEAIVRENTTTREQQRDEAAPSYTARLAAAMAESQTSET